MQEVSEAEQSYATALQKLVKSPLYELHSNIFMQLLGGNPYEEIGSATHHYVDYIYTMCISSLSLCSVIADCMILILVICAGP